MAQSIRGISGRGGTAVVLGDNADTVGFKWPRPLQGAIGGAVIDDDDLDWLPCLCK